MIKRQGFSPKTRTSIIKETVISESVPDQESDELLQLKLLIDSLAVDIAIIKQTVTRPNWIMRFLTYAKKY
jgi:hypothetical protein